MLAAGSSLVALAAGAGPAVAQQPGSHCSGATPAELSAPYVIRLDLTPADLRRDFTDSGGLVDQGFRPLRTTGYSEGAATRYMTKWIKAAGPEIRAEIDLTGGQFDKRFEQRRKDYRPVGISAYTTIAGPRFAVTWLRNTTGTGWKIHRRKTRAQMQDLVDDYAKQGFVPRRVEAPSMGRAAPAPEVRSDRPWYEFLRSANAARCNGREIDNFYITTIDGKTVLDCVVLEAVRAGIATSALAAGSVSTAVPACQGE